MTGTFTEALLFIGPSYVANAAPLLFGGGFPLDGGRNFLDGRRLFGSHKTVRGLTAGIMAGTIVGMVLSFFDGRLFFGGLAIAVGAVLGDLLGAFVKRRLGMKPGSPLPVVDQLDFVFGGLLVGSALFPLGWTAILVVVLLTPPIHLGTNFGAYLLGIKKTYW